MHNCAIICEYNPFHTGHAYQIKRVRDSGASSVFCVMSGNFVQSSMPAFCDKSIRAECAVRGGADAVIELPAVYATASAGFFAEGALKIVSKISGISHLAMGATSPADIILRLAEIKIKHKNLYDEHVRCALKNGKSYNYACAESLCALYGRVYGDGIDVSAVIQEPNNMLCVEYITAIDALNANIEPLIIARAGGRHNSGELDGDYISATAVRTAFSERRADVVARYIPYGFERISEYRRLHSPDIGAYKKAALFALKCADENKISELRDCADGLEYAVKSIECADYDGLVEAEGLKKYGKKKIERLLLDCLLGIKKTHLSTPFITRLLACAKDLDFKLLPDFVKTTNSEIKAARVDGISDVLGVDERASALYGTLCGSADGYYNYSLVKI